MKRKRKRKPPPYNKGMRLLISLLLLTLIGCTVDPLDQNKVGHVRCFAAYGGQPVAEWPTAVLYFTNSEFRDYTHVYEALKLVTTNETDGHQVRYEKGNLIAKWPVNEVVCTVSK